jgi:hypothetical protein
MGEGVKVLVEGHGELSVVLLIGAMGRGLAVAMRVSDEDG